MEPDPFTKLTPQEIEELSLCGITSAAQMATTDPQDILEDLEDKDEDAAEELEEAVDKRGEKMEEAMDEAYGY